MMPRLRPDDGRMSPPEHTPLAPQEAVAQLRERLEQLAPTQGYLYLDGPSGAGKTRLLREFAATTPNAVLVDAAGCTAEQVADRVVRAIGVPHDNDHSSISIS